MSAPSPNLLFALALLAAALNHLVGYRPAAARWTVTLAYTASACLGLVGLSTLAILAQAVGLAALGWALFQKLGRPRR